MIAAVDEGPREGDAVLLLHGQPGSAADWAGVRAELSERFRVVTPDRPGYGETGGPALGIEQNADVMAELLAQRGIASATVAGHSWGAAVALALADRHPEQVRSLVLVCPVTPNGRLGLADTLLADRRVGPPLTRAAFWTAGVALAIPASRRLLDRLLPGYGAERSAEVAREWRRGPTWRSFYREQRALFDELPELRRTQRTLRVPLTVVIGTRDFITDPDAGRRFALALGGRVVEVAGAGHLLPMQAPERVAAAIAAP